MGSSANGLLYYGFVVGGVCEKPEWMDGFDEFDDFVVARAGLENAPDEERWKAQRDCPAEMRSFGHYDYRSYMLCVRAETFVALDWGNTTEIDPEKLYVDEKKVNAFKSWCEVNGVEWQEPRWLLCASYT